MRWDCENSIPGIGACETRYPIPDIVACETRYPIPDTRYPKPNIDFYLSSLSIFCALGTISDVGAISINFSR